MFLNGTQDIPPFFIALTSHYKGKIMVIQKMLKNIYLSTKKKKKKRPTHNKNRTLAFNN